RWQVGTVAAHVFELAQLHRVAFGIVDDCDPHVILPLDDVGISAKDTARPFQLPGDGLYIAHEHAEESPARSRQQVMVGTVARMVEAEALKKLEAFAKWALQLNDPISVAAVSDRLRLARLHLPSGHQSQTKGFHVERQALLDALHAESKLQGSRHDHAPTSIHCQAYGLSDAGPYAVTQSMVRQSADIAQGFLFPWSAQAAWIRRGPGTRGPPDTGRAACR